MTHRKGLSQKIINSQKLCNVEFYDLSNNKEKQFKKVQFCCKFLAIFLLQIPCSIETHSSQKKEFFEKFNIIGMSMKVCVQIIFNLYFIWDWKFTKEIYQGQSKKGRFSKKNPFFGDFFK